MKLKLRILNIFYLLFSTVAIAVYFMSSSFVIVNFDYVIDEEVLYDQDFDDDPLIDLGITVTDIFEDLVDNQLVFTFSANIDYKMMLDAWTVPTVEGVDYFVEQCVLVPSFENSFSEDSDEDSDLEAALLDIANSCVRGMFYTVISQNLALSGLDFNNKLQEAGYSYDMIKTSAQTITTKAMSNSGDISQIHNHFENEVQKYVEAVADDETARANLIAAMERDFDYYLLNLGLVDDDGYVTGSEEVAGHVLQVLVDNQDYDGANEEKEAYVDYENDEIEYSLFTQVFVKVIKNSNLNENNNVFILITLLMRGLGILFVLFVLMWVIKIIQFIACCFRSKPYIRLNPVGVVVGIFELLLAFLHIASLVLYNNNYLSMLRQMNIVGPIINRVLPVGFTIQLLFASLLPGLMVLANFLFSIVYGPVKSKFKKDAREEILYSAEQYDFE